MPVTSDNGNKNSGLSRNKGFSGGGVNERGAGHSKRGVYAGGGGGGGGGSGAGTSDLIDPVSPIVVRISYGVQFEFQDTLHAIIDLKMDGIAALRSRYNYDNFFTGTHIHRDEACGYGLRAKFSAQAGGVRPAAVFDLQNIFPNYFGTAEWNESLPSISQIKAKMLYSVVLDGTTSMQQRMDIYTGAGTWNGASHADTVTNLSTFGINLQYLADMQEPGLAHQEFYLQFFPQSTGYAFTMTELSFSVSKSRRLLDGSDSTWLAAPIT